MTRVLLALIVLLVGCFPVPPADQYDASLTITPRSAYQEVRFSSGEAPALDLKLEVYGLGVRVNAPTECSIVGAHIECVVKALERGKAYVLPATGTALSARATYKRENGSKYTLITP